MNLMLLMIQIKAITIITICKENLLFFLKQHVFNGLQANLFQFPYQLQAERQA